MNIDTLIELANQLQAAIDTGEVMDCYQAADKLGIHHNNLLLAAKSGALKAARVGRTWYTTPDAVDYWRASMKFQRVK